jgi:acyl-CoA synthetase (AMP-forming)/AMP-acid ligase II
MNIAQRIKSVAEKFPEKRSVVFSKRTTGLNYEYPFYTFKDFEERSNQFANRFIKLGIRPGMRTLLFVKPCLDFSIITFALFKVGAIPVLIDPGMGFKNLLACIRQVRPEAMVSIGLVHWIRRLKRSYFKNILIKISLQNVWGNTAWLYKNLEEESKHFKIYPAKLDDYSAILFTSGGTGIPKGVLYTHGILHAQTDALKSMFHLDENQIDVPGFPLFALFTLAMGMTSVIPDMDPTRPAQCDPAKIVKNILDQGASFVAGSPSIWAKVGHYCSENRLSLPTVKYVVMFGAPVRAEIHEMFQQILPQGDTYTPYGATECLPVSLISGKEILQGKKLETEKGAGTCIGQVIQNTEVKIIKSSDIPLVRFEELAPYKIGEIIVSGPQVTPAYFEMPQETEKAKILIDGKLWHRMGDVGYLDNEQNLWFLGRKTHQVIVDQNTVFYPIRIEAIFNKHPLIKRSALVKLSQGGKVFPGLVIERKDQSTDLDDNFRSELFSIASSSPYTKVIDHFFVHPAFPVDVRHNIKIDRVRLSDWAQSFLKN